MSDFDDEKLFTVATSREVDGRWIGEAVELPGTLVYGASKVHAYRKAAALGLRVIADRIEHGEGGPISAHAVYIIGHVAHVAQHFDSEPQS